MFKAPKNNDHKSIYGGAGADNGEDEVGKNKDELAFQTALAISTTEVEYVSVGKACQQALWMKQALIDYGVRLDDIPIMCDNKGAIDLVRYDQTLTTIHIEIRHHCLHD
ncbi:hypothetical protein Tco_0317430 [Tanacetum coccineum]